VHDHEQECSCGEGHSLACEEKEQDSDFHCPCLGSFIGILESIEFTNELLYNTSIPFVQLSYRYIWCPNIYHPPLG
jgi:hypothetical protein